MSKTIKKDDVESDEKLPSAEQTRLLSRIRHISSPAALSEPLTDHTTPRLSKLPTNGINHTPQVLNKLDFPLAYDTSETGAYTHTSL